jgi:hypothetical protein
LPFALFSSPIFSDREELVSPFDEHMLTTDSPPCDISGDANALEVAHIDPIELEAEHLEVFKPIETKTHLTHEMDYSNGWGELQECDEQDALERAVDVAGAFAELEAEANMVTAEVNALPSTLGKIEITKSTQHAIFDSGLNMFNILNHEEFFLEGVQSADHIHLKPAGNDPTSPEGIGTATCYVELMADEHDHKKLRKFTKLTLYDCLLKKQFPNLFSVDKLLNSVGGKRTGNCIDFDRRCVMLANGNRFSLQRYDGLFAMRIYSQREMEEKNQV